MPTQDEIREEKVSITNELSQLLESIRRQADATGARMKAELNLLERYVELYKQYTRGDARSGRSLIKAYPKVKALWEKYSEPVPIEDQKGTLIRKVIPLVQRFTEYVVKRSVTITS